jgi:hypothetical protein
MYDFDVVVGVTAYVVVGDVAASSVVDDAIGASIADVVDVVIVVVADVAPHSTFVDYPNYCGCLVIWQCCSAVE